jgi:hypothetical protein
MDIKIKKAQTSKDIPIFLILPNVRLLIVSVR